MLHYLRRIRQKLIQSGSITKYVLYAFGEMLLVVVGILIALQVSTWNEQRMKKERLVGYYEQIVDELQAAIEANTRSIEGSEELIRLNKRSLMLLNSSNPDSLKALEHTLGALGTVWINAFTVPVVKEFLENSLSQVTDRKLKNYFRTMQAIIEENQSTNEYVQTQYTDAIEPYFVRNLNYQRVALKRYQQYLVAGGPVNDFSRFKGDVVLWNLITFKLELTQSVLLMQTNFQAFATEFIRVLETEIDKYD